MDINCTNNCIYQQEGKCTLNTMPKLTQLNSLSQESGCPYHQETIE